MEEEKEWTKWKCSNPKCKLILYAKPDACPECWFCHIEMIKIDEINDSSFERLT